MLAAPGKVNGRRALHGVSAIIFVGGYMHPFNGTP